MRIWALLLMLAATVSTSAGISYPKDTAAPGASDRVAQSCNPNKHRCG